MVYTTTPSFDQLNYMDYVDNIVFQCLHPFLFISDGNERDRHFVDVAPTMLAKWRLYQITEGGAQRHIYKCLTRYVNQHTFSYIHQAFLQEFHADKIIEFIDNGEVTDENCTNIINAHLETALIANAVDRSKFHIIHNYEDRLTELYSMLERTSQAICKHTDYFKVNYDCYGLQPILNKSSHKVLFFNTVVQALA